MKQSYYIVDLDNGNKFGPYDSLWIAKDKAKSSGLIAAVINSKNDVVCGYKFGRPIEAGE